MVFLSIPPFPLVRGSMQKSSASKRPLRFSAKISENLQLISQKALQSPRTQKRIPALLQYLWANMPPGYQPSITEPNFCGSKLHSVPGSGPETEDHKVPLIQDLKAINLHYQSAMSSFPAKAKKERQRVCATRTNETAPVLPEEDHVVQVELLDERLRPVEVATIRVIGATCGLPSAACIDSYAVLVCQQTCQLLIQCVRQTSVFENLGTRTPSRKTLLGHLFLGGTGS